MRNETLGGYPSIDSFVRAKLDRLFSGELSFSRLFSEMFSEGGNVLYERSTLRPKDIILPRAPPAI